MHDTRLHGADDWRKVDDPFPPRDTILGLWKRVRDANPDPTPASPYDDQRELGWLWHVADAYEATPRPTDAEVDALFAATKPEHAFWSGIRDWPVPVPWTRDDEADHLAALDEDVRRTLDDDAARG